MRETIRFSAQLRLDKNNPVHDTPNGLEEHIDLIMKTFELTREAELLVGNEEDGGLTFDQKKRLSIAVEVAASPSIVFLGEQFIGGFRLYCLIQIATHQMHRFCFCCIR